jgi:hypothetical protein
MLNPSDAELEKIRDMGVAAGILTKTLPIREMVDRSFIPANIKAADIDASRQ